MKDNKLISMLDFISSEVINKKYSVKSFKRCEDYAHFLNTPLNISMFVPAIKVGDKWVVLEIPNSIKGKKTAFEWQLIKEQYQTAKDNVIFKGFELTKVDDLGYYNLESEQMIIEVYMPLDADTEFLDILDNGLERIEDLVKFKLRLTKKGIMEVDYEL